jgi:hypothetical protein
MRFRLRTLLILLAVLPPIIAYWYRQQSDIALWERLDDAKRQRDASLSAWRVAYDESQFGNVPASKADAEAKRYYKARGKVEAAWARLLKRYGGEKQLTKAREELIKQR